MAARVAGSAYQQYASTGYTSGSVVDLYDDDALVPQHDQDYFSGIRLPDGRALTWAEYGSPRSLPCLLIPDAGSSRLAPRWLLHDSALPTSVRLLALDRPGVGASDPVAFGGVEDPAEDLRHLVETLAVGRIAVLGIGQGVDEAMTFASRYPTMVTEVIAVSARLTPPRDERRRALRAFTWSTGTEPAGPVAAWTHAAGSGSDLAEERSWRRATRRMDERSRRVLGDRWLDTDFRQSLAADLGQSSGEWTKPAVAPRTPHWTSAAPRVPARFWHGRDEAGTTLARMRAVVDGHADWHLSVVDGCSAIFGAWPQILSAAAASFQAAA